MKTIHAQFSKVLTTGQRMKRVHAQFSYELPMKSETAIPKTHKAQKWHL